MTPRSFQRLDPGGSISASDYNRLMDYIEQMIRVTASPPLQASFDSSGLHLSILGIESFWIRLSVASGSASGSGSASCDFGSGSGSGSGACLASYQWTKVIFRNGCWEEDAEINSIAAGCCAYEVNGNFDIVDGTIVRAYWAEDRTALLFEFGAAGAGEGGAPVTIDVVTEVCVSTDSGSASGPSGGGGPI